METSRSAEVSSTASDALNDARELLQKPSHEARRRLLVSLNLIYAVILLLHSVAQLAATGHLPYPERDNVLMPLGILVYAGSAAYNLLVLRGRPARPRLDVATRWATVLMLQGTALAIVHMNPNTATSYLIDHAFALLLIFVTGVLLGRRAALIWTAVTIASVVVGMKARGGDFEYHLMTSREVAALKALDPAALGQRLDLAARERLVPLPIGLFASVMFVFIAIAALCTYFEVGTLHRMLAAIPGAIAKIQLATERENALVQDKVRLQAELDFAQRVQSALVPARSPVSGYDIANLYRPALDVGGDCYDLIPGDRATWILVGDVSGHGVSAGLIMIMAQTAVRAAIVALAQRGEEPSSRAVLGVVNTALRQNVARIGSGHYMTATLLRIDGSRVRYAGLHQDLLVHRAATKTVERIETGGIWLGVVDDIEPLLDEATLELSTGDVLLLYTDGLTEAKVGSAMLGVEGLERSFAAAAVAHERAEEIVRAIIDEHGEIAFRDDVTLVAVKRTGG